ncbi:MAG: hypothetical protein ABSF99_09905, partial [Anaerolineales bacterium]
MKNIGLIFLMVVVLVLSACGSSPSANTSQVAAATLANTGDQSITDSSLNTSYTNAIPIEYQLLFGTFKLEGTDLTVTAKQANVLVPLWQQIQTMSPSMGPGTGNASQGQTGATTTAQAGNSDSQT